MSKVAEFEEKTYEKYFFGELLSRCSHTFSPGQVQESFIGFDDGFFIPWYHRLFFPFETLALPRLRQLPGIDSTMFEDDFGELIKHLPPFKLNLFIQYKRPEFVTSGHAKQRLHWNKSYYRYKIDQEQQSLLDTLHQVADGRAAVLYAAPAFYLKDSLFKAASKRQIIQKSNIAQAYRLTGHTVYTYADAGSHGIACSDPVSIESDDIDNLLNNSEENEPLSLARHLKQTEAVLKEVIGETALSTETSRQVAFRLARAAVIERLRLTRETSEIGPILSALISIEAFCDAFQLSYRAVG